MGLRPNINFLLSKKNKSPNIDLKILKQWTGIAITRHALYVTQKRQSSIMKYE